MKAKMKPWLFPLWLLILIVLIGFGLAGAYQVLSQGLVITNLTDLVPWGLWIGIDLSVIALSAGAFTLSAAVYLLRKDEFKPIARTAVFIGLLGYTMAMMTLLLDIGRPDRFWHALVYWNIHSPLWEVTMCVALYFTVLLLEVTPIVGRADVVRLRWPRLGGSLEWIHVLASVLAVIGLLLSLMHQSSLGATYGVLAARPFWYRSSLAVLFLVSAIAAGLALTVLASYAAAAVSSRAQIDRKRLDSVAKIIGWVLVVYLYLRLWDTLSMVYTHQPGRTEALTMLTSGAFAQNFWVFEVLLGILIPMIILLSDRLRRRSLLFAPALIFVIVGLIAFRWDTNMVGQLVVFSYLPDQTVPLFTGYRPAPIEWQVGAGIIAFGLLGFTIGVRYLEVVLHPPLQTQPERSPRVSVAAAAD